MIRAMPSRSLIAILLAAWMPWCCCILRTLMADSRACGDHRHQDADAAGASDGSSVSHVDACGGHQHDEVSVPLSPQGDPQDQKPCTCDSHKQTTIGLDKTTIEFPATVVLFPLPNWDLSWAPRWSSMALRTENWNQLRPATSLLRQHCALIV